LRSKPPGARWRQFVLVLILDGRRVWDARGGGSRASGAQLALDLVEQPRAQQRDLDQFCCQSVAILARPTRLALAVGGSL